MKIHKTILITIALPIITFVGIVAASPTVGADGSANSTITQVIRAMDCTHTTYDRAVGQMNDAECNIFEPKHERMEIATNGYPIMYGVYDAVHAVLDPLTGRHSLAIEVAGRRFLLGVDPELRVDGNAWVLDLANWANTNPVGTEPVLERGKTYPVAIFVVVRPHGSVQQIKQMVNSSITIPDNSVVSGAASVISSAIGGILAATGANIWTAAAVTFGLIVVTSLILLRRKKLGGEYG